MNELFGLSMNYIMIGLLIVLGVALSTVAWVAVRNRVLFFIGLRNIPRRRAQTILIVIGLMLSTLIISTAFSIGDTVNYSITNQVYDNLHSVDEIVQAKTNDDGGGGGPGSIVAPAPIPQAQAESLAQQFRVRRARRRRPADDSQHRPHEQSARQPHRARHRARRRRRRAMKGFESDIESVDGGQLSISDLAPDEIYVNESLAEKIETVVGDKVQIFTNDQPHEFTVRGIVKDDLLTGNVIDISRGFVMNMERAQQLLDRPDEVDLDRGLELRRRLRRPGSLEERQRRAQRRHRHGEVPVG